MGTFSLLFVHDISVYLADAVVVVVVVGFFILKIKAKNSLLVPPFGLAFICAHDWIC